MSFALRSVNNISTKKDISVAFKYNEKNLIIGFAASYDSNDYSKLKSNTKYNSFNLVRDFSVITYYFGDYYTYNSTENYIATDKTNDEIELCGKTVKVLNINGIYKIGEKMPIDIPDFMEKKDKLFYIDSEYWLIDEEKYGFVGDNGQYVCRYISNYPLFMIWQNNNGSPETQFVETEKEKKLPDTLNIVYTKKSFSENNIQGATLAIGDYVFTGAPNNENSDNTRFIIGPLESENNIWDITVTLS